MLGEPTYMKYGAGGSVGHAPWQKPTVQPQQQQQLDTPTPQVGGAQTPGRGQPNPMKGPRGLPSLAPTNHGPGIHAATGDAKSDDGPRTTENESSARSVHRFRKNRTVKY